MKDSNMTQRFAEVANLIAPTDTPPWLAEFLRDWASSLMLYRGVHAIQPTKVKMRQQLIEVSNAAAILQRALQDIPTREFLELEGAIRIENVGGLDNTLRVISERATLAAASPRISATSASAKSGRGKALPTNSLPTKAFCAVIISEAWKYVHGEYPAPRNVKAAAAAEAYWRASGGVTNSWGLIRSVVGVITSKKQNRRRRKRTGRRFTATASNIHVGINYLAPENNWARKPPISLRT